MCSLTPDQAKVLLSAAKDSDDRLEALYVLAVHTGLRQGELLGLKWDDVDLENGTLQVWRTLSVTKNGPVLSTSKTRGSNRGVKLTSQAVEALQNYLERQLVEIDSAGSLWQENGLIFASEAGLPLDSSAGHQVSLQATPEARRLPETFRFHDLRHTCATLLLSRNVNPKIVSEMLDHASIAITLDTYSHVLPNMRDQVTKAMEEALS